MRKRTCLIVAVAAGSLALGGFLLSHSKAQPAPGAPAAAAPAEPPVDPGKVVITIGNMRLTAGEFQNFLNSLSPDVRALASGGGKRTLGEEFVRLKLLSAEATRQGLDKTDTFRQQMAIMRDNVLVGVLLQKMQDDLAGPDDVKKYYEDNRAKFEQVKARHILIPVGGDKGLTDAQAKAKAQDIRERIQNGAKFADIAKAESGDEGTKDEGGDLQPFARGVMVPEFEEVAFTLKPGVLSQPVKTEFGYHIILVEKREIPSFEQMKDAVTDKLRQQNFERFYDELKKKADPKFDESFFPPAKAEKDEN